METINQHKAVQEQYMTAGNLNTRISIHAKYSINKLGFSNWLFSNYNFSANNKILELGCGTGDMWKFKLHLIDKSIKLTLTDLSENMVFTAKNTLGEQNNVSYGIVDIENIPYADNSFDRVIAKI